MHSLTDIIAAGNRLGMAETVRKLAMAAFDETDREEDLNAWNAADDATDLARLDFYAALRAAGINPDTLRDWLNA